MTHWGVAILYACHPKNDLEFRSEIPNSPLTTARCFRNGKHRLYAYSFFILCLKGSIKKCILL